MLPTCRRLRVFLLCAAGVLAGGAGLAPCAVRAESPPAASPSDLEQRLLARLASQPDSAASWRLLGRMRLRRGELVGAREALERALALDPHSAAAHFDYAQLLLAAGQPAPAAAHFQHAAQLAPESEYARDAGRLLPTLPEPDGEILLAAYEIRRFDGSDRASPPIDALRGVLEPQRSLFLRLETGVLFNSNVALAPTSRELAPGRRESFQVFLAPELEHRGLQGEGWAAGPTFRGYFNLNEGPFRSLNLESFRPGFFVERIVVCESFDVIPRLQYEFTHDAFDGVTFASRHALVGSAAVFWNGGHSSFAYLAADHTNFAGDGVLPAFTSRDGETWAAGVSHTVFVGAWRLEAVRAGLDIERADTEGRDFRYHGVTLYGEAVLPLDDTLRLILQGGWGHRDYFDFDLRPPRREHIWRAAARVEKRLSPHWLVSAVVHYDRFDSRNDLFDAERTVGGFVTTFEY